MNSNIRSRNFDQKKDNNDDADDEEDDEDGDESISVHETVPIENDALVSVDDFYGTLNDRDDYDSNDPDEINSSSIGEGNEEEFSVVNFYHSSFLKKIPSSLDSIVVKQGDYVLPDTGEKLAKLILLDSFKCNRFGHRSLEIKSKELKRELVSLHQRKPEAKFRQSKKRRQLSNQDHLDRLKSESNCIEKSMKEKFSSTTKTFSSSITISTSNLIIEDVENSSNQLGSNMNNIVCERNDDVNEIDLDSGTIWLTPKNLRFDRFEDRTMKSIRNESIDLTLKSNRCIEDKMINHLDRNIEKASQLRSISSKIFSNFSNLMRQNQRTKLNQLDLIEKINHQSKANNQTNRISIETGSEQQQQQRKQSKQSLSSDFVKEFQTKAIRRSIDFVHDTSLPPNNEVEENGCLPSDCWNCYII